MNMIRKFAFAVLAATFGLTGCDILSVRPEEIKLPEKTREMLANKDWYVSSEIGYYDLTNLMKVGEEANRKKEKVRFTRQFPKLVTPPPATVAIANMVMKNFREDMAEKGLNIVKEPCDQCLVVKIDLGHYEGEILKFLFVIPVWQKVTYLNAKATVLHKNQVLLETDEIVGVLQSKGLLEEKAHQEARAATATAQYVAEQIAAFAKNRPADFRSVSAEKKTTIQ